MNLLKDAFFIIILSAIIGFIINIFHTNGYELIGKKALGYEKIVFLSIKEAKIKYDSGSSVFVDSRNSSEFNCSHIKGALNIPSIPESMSLEKLKTNFSVLNGPNELILYCDGTECGSSEELAKKIIDLGYSRNIYIIKNGIPRWEEMGYPVENTEKRD